ncbi:uncharacterized protein MEPE_00009 [Melanopsichium pennsylvanicum]|uniref:Carbohydrate kinase PfkB domain-containing protein n=2 Tax=Melanopsichium pennsylvanicum TaxID=63383 RepID=A0AAJ4XF94_9BASI|nr:conserved hypothetical protein [Melanopsichium pennsylvanicum 4]SNX81304.1 uncharacterized protein MEPE_00009 [Melanopsichium pennsylvanicum]
MAETATRVLSPFHSASSSSPVKLVSPHGNDAFGLLLHAGMQQAGMRTEGLFSLDGRERTAVCSLMLDGLGDLISGVADMDIGKIALSPASQGSLKAFLEEESPRLVVFDGNIGSDQASQLLAACEAHQAGALESGQMGLLTLFEPTSVSKSTIFLSHFAGSSPSKRQPISFATPNAVELEQIHATTVDLGLLPPLSPSSLPGSAEFKDVLAPGTLAKAQALVDAGLLSTILLKVGVHGVITVSHTRVEHHRIPAGEVQVVNTTGCGDSFAGAFTAVFSHLIERNQKVKQETPAWHQMVDKAVKIGQLAARRTLASTRAVGEGMHLLLQGCH